MSIRAKVGALWNRLWFVPGSALELAAARVVIALHALWVLLSRDLPELSGLPPEFYARLSAGMRWRYLLFEGHPELERGLEIVLFTSLLAAALGWWARSACLVSALLLYHLAPLETLMWTSEPYERGFSISVLALVVLAASPCGDALRFGRARRPEREASEYGWGLRLVQLFLAQVYLFSGYAKWKAVGWEWASAQNLREWLLIFDQQDQVAVFRGLGAWIADRPALCLGAGVLGIGLDFLFVVAVFSRRLRILVVPLALAFHVGILFAMNVAFLNVPQLLLFVNWDSLAARRAGSGRASPSGSELAAHGVHPAPVSPR